jgi:PAS domain S-box-containing protein
MVAPTDTIGDGRKTPAARLRGEALIASEARYRRLFETAKDGILIIDADTERIIDVNPFMVQLLGYRSEEVVGQALWRLCPFKDIRANKTAFKELLREGYIRYEHLPLETKDGRSIAVEFISSVFLVEGQRTIQCIIRDNSKRKQAEKWQSQNRFQIEQVHQTVAIEKLAGGIAHQFNNALAIIKGILSLMEKDKPPAKISENLGSIKNAAERMIRLTHDLLAYANGGKYVVETMALSDLVRDSLALFETTLKPSISIQADLPPSLPAVKADRAQIQAVLLAILANASEAIEIHGKIQVICRLVALTDDSVKPFEGLVPYRYVCLVVKDNGKGMDIETKERLFEPFFTNHLLGRGLGMAAVYGIVKNHGGYIFVESQIGQGTEVRVYLPAVKSEEQTTLHSQLPEPYAKKGAGG